MQRSIVGYFINFLKELLQSEKTLQALRKELSSIKKYHPLCIFQKIAGRKEQITIRMMNDYLKDRVACNEREVYEIFEKFDHQRLGVIERADFCREVHSKGKKMEKFREGISITHEIEAKFINYLTTIVKSGRVLDVWRKELLSIEPYAIFKALDSNLDGVIGPLQLHAFFLRNSEQLNLQNAIYLHRIMLRRHFQELNLQVFCQNLNPLEFGGYQTYRRSLGLQAKAELREKEEKNFEALEVEHNFYKQLKNQKTIELIHKQASLLREKQLQDRVADELRVYQDLKFLTRKKYHPQLTYDQYLLMEKENLQRANLQKQFLLEEAARKDLEYRQKLRTVDVVREVQAFQRSKLERLPFMTVKNRIESSLNSNNQAFLKERIKQSNRHHLNPQNRF